MALIHQGRFDRVKKPNIRLHVPPDPRYARTVRDAIIAFTSLHAVAAEDVEPLLFAIGEALANAIEHAGCTADIEVFAELDHEMITARITDSGSGITHVPRGTTPLPHGLAEGGRGIPIMQRCADVFDMEALPGVGTVVTLGRVLRKSAQDSAVAS